MAVFWGSPLTSAPVVSVSSKADVSLGSPSGTVAWSCFGVVGGDESSLSLFMGSGDWGLGETGSDSKVVVVLPSQRLGLEVVLGQV